LLKRRPLSTIQKAVQSGWNPYELRPTSEYDPWIKRMTLEAVGLRSRFDLSDCTVEIIYNQEFAKALWQGTTLNSLAGTYPHDAPEWQYHLQRMVIAESSS
jgi:hypothetical protein